MTVGEECASGLRRELLSEVHGVLELLCGRPLSVNHSSINSFGSELLSALFLYPLTPDLGPTSSPPVNNRPSGGLFFAPSDPMVGNIIPTHIYIYAKLASAPCALAES